MTQPLILIDASGYFFRAFHALPPLTNSKGQPTGAIYGVVNMIKRLLKDYPSEKVAVVFDAKGKTFRNDLYPEYKAHRPPMPEELSSQFSMLLAIIEAMGLPILMIEGVEADDVIGTLAKHATLSGHHVVISTSDKDLAQLVNESVTLINTMTNKTLTIDAVKEKFGVYPEQIIDYLTLVGDNVDNIVGVNKCGPKTAAKWLETYETLDNLLTNAGEISGKIGENLREAIAYLPLSKQLVTIKTDVELPCSIETLQKSSGNRDALIKITQELEFKNWLQELQTVSTEKKLETTQQDYSCQVITEINQWQSWFKRIATIDTLTLYLATTQDESMLATLVGLALRINAEEPVYIPFQHAVDYSQLSFDTLLNDLKILLEDRNIPKLGHDLKSTYIILKNHGINLQGMTFDTMLESYVLNSTAAKHDLSTLSLKYLNHSMISYEEIAGKGAKKLNLNQLTVEKALPYIVDNITTTLNLHHKLAQQIMGSLTSVFYDIEMPLLQILADIERQGVLIDIDTLGKHGKRLKERIATLEQEVIQLAGRPFNLNSPKQLQELLFDEQKLPVISKTPTGQPSTAESVLQELAFDYPLPALILEYRMLTKLVTTYIDALPKRVNAQTQRVHTCYNQAVAATGRLSSSEPNLQNIPIRNEEGRLIRTAFVAPKDCLILAADYSQIELRIMAHLSRDANLLNAFAKGWDIHTATAAEIFQVPSLKDVTHEQRRRAKAVNFGLIYGMSAFGLARQLDIDRIDAQRYLELYFQRYPGVHDYMERTRHQAHQQGFVETLFGRRLYLPEINVRNLARQRAAERMAINAPMQGTAADIIKKAMIAIATWQAKHVSSFKMIMQVHDELVFEVAKNAIEEASETIRDLMENAVTLTVPLNVTIGIGNNWDEAHI